MNPSIALNLAIALLLVVGGGIAVAALIQAPDGFEDDAGFHACRVEPSRSEHTTTIGGVRATILSVHDAPERGARSAGKPAGDLRPVS